MLRATMNPMIFLASALSATHPQGAVRHRAPAPRPSLKRRAVADRTDP